MSYPTTRSNTSSKGIGWIFAIFLVTVVPITLFNGWVLSVMWNWFVPNIFDTFPRLSIGEAIGLSLVISTLLYIPSSSDNEVENFRGRFSVAVVTHILRSFMLLAMGAIVHGIVF